MLAKAVASESNANFIAVKGPEIFNKWVGESERKIRDLFKKARQLAPSIIFFDEIDSITKSREATDISNSQNNVVAQLLTEIDGITRLKDVIIIGATNRIDIIDPAFLRPGRFDKLLYVPLPNTQGREKIFEVYLKKLNVSKKVNAKTLAKETDFEDRKISGADIEGICREASMIAIRRIIENKDKEKDQKIKLEDFRQAIKKIKKTKEKDDDESNRMVH
jgi:transitional endoplasmic reticulum ATPase